MQTPRCERGAAEEKQCDQECTVSTPQSLPDQACHAARLRVEHGGLYSVNFRGEPVVRRSRDPECDAARVLLARDIRGTVRIIDANTGVPRTVVNIEKAARAAVREDRGTGPRFVKWRPMPPTARERCEGQAPSRESHRPRERHWPTTRP
jgi:hypothetical protein